MNIYTVTILEYDYDFHKELNVFYTTSVEMAEYIMDMVYDTLLLNRVMGDNNIHNGCIFNHIGKIGDIVKFMIEKNETETFQNNGGEIYANEVAMMEDTKFFDEKTQTIMDAADAFYYDVDDKEITLEYDYKLMPDELYFHQLPYRSICDALEENPWDDGYHEKLKERKKQGPAAILVGHYLKGI